MTEAKSFGPAITREMVHDIEQTENECAVIRRCAIATLAQSSDELLDGTTEEKMDALVAFVEGLAEYLEWRKSETELLEAAHARLSAVLSIKSVDA